MGAIPDSPADGITPPRIARPLPRTPSETVRESHPRETVASYVVGQVRPGAEQRVDSAFQTEDESVVILFLTQEFSSQSPNINR